MSLHIAATSLTSISHILKLLGCQRCQLYMWAKQDPLYSGHCWW